MDKKIAAIIPAYCEAPRISTVLDLVCQSEMFSRVVVVDDGSTDDTAHKIKPYPVQMIRHEKNLGKGAAIQTGLQHAGNFDLVVFLDADLTGMTRGHLQSLIDPLIESPESGMTIAQFIEGRSPVDLQQKWFAILNGQRALTRQFTDLLPDISWTRFGIEVFLNRFAYGLGIPFVSVPWKGVSHHLKEEKFGPVLGFYARIKMYKEALATYATYQRRAAELRCDQLCWDLMSENRQTAGRRA